MTAAKDGWFQGQLDELQRLYAEGLLSEANYRAALTGLGADPATVFDQRDQQVEEQRNVAGPYVDKRQSSDTYVRIEHAREVSFRPQQQARATEARAGAPPLDDAAALTRYLDHIIDAYRCLQLQGIRSAGHLVSIDLEQVYITLTATGQGSVAEEQAWLEEMARLAPGEPERLEQLGAGPPRQAVTQIKVKVQEALEEHPRLVVLGDPGCGKTTLLRYLALTYARDMRGEAGLVEQRLQLQEQRLPIFLPLRNLSQHLRSNHPDPSLDGPKLLVDYLRTYFANQYIHLPERFFADRLESGGCVVLLDGVDEVADPAMRQRVARLIEHFTLAYPGNRYVLTSRIVGYSGTARLAADYRVTTVRDFTQADIQSFVSNWNTAVEVALARKDTATVRLTAERKTRALVAAIQSNERLRELAVNPLLLTVIALVQRYRAQLPERRTELYEEAIEVLLGKWDEAKGLQTREVMAGRELDAGDRRGLLEPVALRMMGNRARDIEAAELRRQLQERFLQMVMDRRQADQAVDGFLQLINERSGLLAERGQGVYTFSHLTFQEHLAARAVADRADYIPYTLARLGDPWWREVILLEAGYLSTQGKRRATALIQAIMDCRDEPAPYHNLVLAAECLRDVGPARVEGDLASEVQQRLRREFDRPLRPSAVGRLLGRVLQRRSVSSEAIRRRAVAAEALARIESGVPGTQPAFWRLPHGEPTWIPVPAGEFWMGSEQLGLAVNRLHLDGFQIARVPITNAQYRLFVEASGHEAPSHWEDRRVPRGRESHPVANVSWDDAVAYCRWLSEVTGKAVTLPSEAQWEKAARGDKDGREYPWGDEWQEGMCNSVELGVRDTTPVGIFPEGASPYGCLDVAGNVWEWTSTAMGVGRVLRGGSFYVNQNCVRCACRSWVSPFFRYRLNGFRVVVSPRGAPA